MAKTESVVAIDLTLSGTALSSSEPTSLLLPETVIEPSTLASKVSNTAALTWSSAPLVTLKVSPEE